MSVTLFLALALWGCLEKEIRDMPPVAQPPTALQTCSADTDCILIDISCTGCCQRDAINRKDSLEYLDHKKSICVGDRIAVCGCCFFPARAACDSGVCRYLELGQTCGK